jgi:hypothetical protein
MKLTHTQDKFIELCNAVTRHNMSPGVGLPIEVIEEHVAISMGMVLKHVRFANHTWWAYVDATTYSSDKEFNGHYYDLYDLKAAVSPDGSYFIWPKNTPTKTGLKNSCGWSIQ